MKRIIRNIFYIIAIVAITFSVLIAMVEANIMVFEQTGMSLLDMVIKGRLGLLFSMDQSSDIKFIATYTVGILALHTAYDIAHKLRE